jgi:hypothetical protein
MDDRLWYVSKDDGDDSAEPVAAYDSQELAELAATTANEGLSWEQYTAESIPRRTQMPRIERTLHLATYVLDDRTLIAPYGAHEAGGISERTYTTPHFDPDEADEDAAIRSTVTRAYTYFAPPRSAVRIEAEGTNRELVREVFANRLRTVQKQWLPPVWTATFDDLSVTADPDTGHVGKRRQTQDLPLLSDHIPWLAEQWQAEKIGPVSLEHWPTREKIDGVKLEQLMLKHLTKAKS